MILLIKNSQKRIIKIITASFIQQLKIYFKQIKKTAGEQLLFDSGDNNFYKLSIAHFELFRKRNIYTILSGGYGSNAIGLHGNAPDTVNYRALVPEMIINGAMMQNPSTQTTSDNNSRIGSKLLEYGIVAIDYKNKKFYFDPFSKASDLFKKHYAVNPTTNNNKLYIGITCGEKLKDMVNAGYQIIAIDGVNYENAVPCDFITALSPMEGKGKGKINKTGTIKEITLNLNNLLETEKTIRV